MKVSLFGVGLLALSSTFGLAQAAPAPAPAPMQRHAATINQRRENQQQRIAQGVRSGQMTAGETGNVENREASIHNQAAADRAANGGHLTAQEHQQINQRQNNVSKSINEDKHNANTQEHPHAEEHGGGHEPKR